MVAQDLRLLRALLHAQLRKLGAAFDLPSHGEAGGKELEGDLADVLAVLLRYLVAELRELLVLQPHYVEEPLRGYLLRHNLLRTLRNDLQPVFERENPAHGERAVLPDREPGQGRRTIHLVIALFLPQLLRGNDA